MWGAEGFSDAVAIRHFNFLAAGAAIGAEPIHSALDFIKLNLTWVHISLILQ